MKARYQIMLAALLIGTLTVLTNVGAPLLQAIAQNFQQTIRFDNGTPNGATARWATDTNGFYGGTGFVGVTRHLAAGAGTVPTGTTVTIATGSSDFAGTGTTTSTTGSINFATAYTARPTCTVLQATGGVLTQPTYSVSTTAIHLHVALNAAVYDWICIAKSGG